VPLDSYNIAIGSEDFKISFDGNRLNPPSILNKHDEQSESGRVTP
jgi:hypothetical protein